MAYFRRLPSKRWQAVVTRGGRRWTQTASTKAAVVEWARRAEDDLDLGLDPSRHRRQVVTVGEWAERWQHARMVEPTTARKEKAWLDGRILPAWGGVRLVQLSTLGLQGWVSDMAGQIAPASVRSCYGVMHLLLEAAVREHLLARNPAAGVALPAVPPGREVYLTQVEVDDLATALAEPYATVVIFLAYTGLRWGEMAGLRRRRVDMVRRRVDVVETHTRYGPKAYPKSRRLRTVGLPSHLVERLGRHLTASPGGPDTLVFRGVHSGDALSEGQMRKHWRPALATAGLEGRAPHVHDLRHTAASWLVQAGVPLYEVSAFLGHSSLRVTERYAHLGPTVTDRTTQALER